MCSGVNTYYYQLGSGNVGDNPYDNNPTFEQIADAAYEAAYVFNNHPNASSALSYMQALTALDKYLTANPPPAGSIGAALLNDLNTVTPNQGQTLAQMCANPYVNGNIQYLVDHSNISAVSNFFQDVYNVNNSYVDKNKPGFDRIQQDILDIISYIKIYNQDASAKTPDPERLQTCAIAISRALFEFNYHVAEFGGVQDGFLTILLTQLGCGASTDPQSPSLFSLASAEAQNPLDPTATANFLAALNSMGENSASGGSLLELFEKSYTEEWGSLPNSA
ncbi:MAG: hypothetical protein WCF19_04650 [Chlamydiales bacterium]